MNVAVVGLGKIGLPLAVQVAGSGARVVGADVDPRVVESVTAGLAPFAGEEDLDDLLRDAVASGSLTATTDTVAACRAADVVLVLVPLVTRDGVPDFTAIDAATAAIGAGLPPGALVSYETTLPVGTTRERFAPALAARSGLVVGRDLFVCHSPERVSSGRVLADLRRYPKLVGGADPESGRRACAFYASVLTFDDRPDLGTPNGVWDLGSAEAAELTKLAETTYRDVNIALANQFARHADAIGVDVGLVIRAANSQPYSHVHRPGIAVGGHCIPVYPHFYLAGDPTATLPRAARAANAAMPEYAVARLAELAGDLRGLRAVVLGLSYRGGVKESAFSGAFDVVAALESRGATTAVHDPMYDDAEIRAFGLTPFHLGEACDVAVLQTDHVGYAALSPADLPGVQAVLDGRGVLDPAQWPGITIGWIGRPPARGSRAAPAP